MLQRKTIWAYTVRLVATTALAGVVVGAVLGLLSALAIESRRDRRVGRAAARIIQTELLEIVLTASSVSPTTTYPFPFKDAAWHTHGDRWQCPAYPPTIGSRSLPSTS